MEQAEPDESVESAQPKRRGRPFIPISWAPVMSLDHDEPVRMVLREVSTDLKLAEGFQRVPNTRRVRTWAPLYCPRQFVTDHTNMALATFKLSTAKLKSYAILISKLRNRIKKDATKTASQVDCQFETTNKEVE